MKRLLSREGLSEKVTLRVTVRALAISIAVFALVVSFAIVGGYQGIVANRNAQQATKNYVSQSHTNRLQVEADLQAQIQDVYCTIIGLVPVSNKLREPFRSKVIAIINEHDCATYNKTHNTPPPVIPKKAVITPSPKVPSSTPQVTAGRLPSSSKGPTAPSSTRSGSASGASKTPPPHPPAPKPSSTPPPTVKVPPPLLPPLPILAPVCKLLILLLHTCIIQ